LRARAKEEDALREEEVNRLKREVGEVIMDLDILREAALECVEYLAFRSPGCGRARHSLRCHRGSMRHWPSADFHHRPKHLLHGAVGDMKANGS
jgi:hypothetical protein